MAPSTVSRTWSLLESKPSFHSHSAFSKSSCPRVQQNSKSILKTHNKQAKALYVISQDFSTQPQWFLAQFYVDKHSNEHSRVGASSSVTLLFWKENEAYCFHNLQDELLTRNLSLIGNPTTNPPWQAIWPVAMWLQSQESKPQAL